MINFLFRINSLIESSDTCFEWKAISMAQSSLVCPRSYNSIFYEILALPKGKEKSSEIGNTRYLPSVSINFYQKDIRLNNAKE